MKTFIPSREEPDTDDSGDEIPPGGVFPLMDPGVDEDQDEDDDNHDGLNGDVNDIGGDDEEDDMEDEDLAEESSDDENFVEMSSDSEGEEEEEDKDGANDSDADSSDGEEATMESLFGIKPNVKASNCPPDLEDESGIVDMNFHPEHDLISFATMAGDVITYKYDVDVLEEVARYTHHKDSCRAVRYSHDGATLYTVSKDLSLAVLDTQNSSLKHRITDAHSSPIHSLLPINPFTCATGDDDGTVKLWDLRTNRSVFDFKCGEDTVTSLLTNTDKKLLVASVSDGSIAGFNIRAKRLEVQSELYDAEMNSMCLVRNQSKLVVSSSSGLLYVFNWGEFGYHIDQFKGITEEVGCMVPVADRLVLTGSEDGVIRAVHLYPHLIVGIVGQHKNFGVHNMALSRDGTYVASCSQDGAVRFWNVKYLYNTTLRDKIKKNRRQFLNLKSSRQRNNWDFFRDMPNKLESSDDEAGPVAGPSTSEDPEDRQPKENTQDEKAEDSPSSDESTTSDDSDDD